MHTSVFHILKWTLAAIHLLIVLSLCAQYDKASFAHYTVRDGLSDNYVTCFWQDSRGYIWIGTDNGLNRFDGNRFEKYYQDAPLGFLESSLIREIKGVSGDRFAVVTSNQASIVAEDDFEVHHLAIKDTTSFSLLLNAIWDMIEIPNHGFGLTTVTGFYFFDTDGNLVFRHDAFTIKDVGNRRMLYGRHMLSLPGDKIFVYVEDDKQGLYDLRTNTFTLLSSDTGRYRMLCHPSGGLPHITSSQISAHEYIIVPQSDSLIYFDLQTGSHSAYSLPFVWIDELSWRSRVMMLNDTTFAINGGYYGFFLFHLDRKTKRISGGQEKYFGDQFVIDVFVDNQDRMWIATDKGLWKQSLQQPFIRTDTISIPAVARMQTRSGNSIGSISSGYLYKDKLYLTRYSQDCSLVVVDPDNFEVEEYFCLYPQGGYNSVLTMQMYHPDTLWLGALNGIVWFDVKTHAFGKLQDNPAYRTLGNFDLLAPIGKDSIAWMASYLFGRLASYHVGTHEFRVFDEHSVPPHPFKRIKSLTYDAYGDVWFSGHGLARWNVEKQKFDTLITEYAGPNKYNDDILLMVADRVGSLWLANPRNGLLEYEIARKQWKHYGFHDLISSLDVESISPVIGDNIWFTDANHLHRMNLREKSIDIYDHTDGLRSGISDFRYMYYDSTRERMHLFNGDMISHWDAHPDLREIPSSDVIIQSITINADTTIHFPSKELNFSFRENNLVLHYTIIDFEDGPGHQFSYRLDEEDAWIALGHQRELYLTNLASGKYAMEIKARASNGKEKISSVYLTIARPFWSTFWFIGLCIAAISLVGFLIYKRRIASIRAKADLDKQLTEAEMKALHTQMNPHFIFNSLNSIREMMVNHNIPEASRYLNVFAQMIRMTLLQSRQPYITLRDTMEYLQRYVEMERIRNSDFTFQLFADPALDEDETMLPPMLIQPFIENAIWHGMNGENRAIHISVTFTKKDTHLNCIIRDDGVGIHQSAQRKALGNSKHQSVGISNIQKRIDLLNQKHRHEGGIRIEDLGELTANRETGTMVTLTLPLDISES